MKVTASEQSFQRFHIKEASVFQPRLSKLDSILQFSRIHLSSQ